MTKTLKHLAPFVLLCSFLCGGSAFGAEKIDYSLDIRPLLSDNCFRCHGPDADNREADLRLDIREDAVSTGAIEPGESGSSETLARIQSADPELVMPPPSTGKQLSELEISKLRDWIDQGAEYSDHWAFVPPVRPTLPAVRDQQWVRNPIDQFVAAKLDRHDLKPSSEADKVTLIRRLYLDLVGLPPTPGEVDRFVADPHEQAYQRVIDQLLRSQHFGERWARWWLDAARYSDSDGYEKDKQRSVWAYRDWVIDAMNRDMPYNDFIIHQIGGDLLPEAGQAERVATGFLRNSMVNEEGGADPEQFRVEAMFDRIDAIGKAILGITTQCAQCHTHKYDPLSQREFYQMFAALNGFHEATATTFTPGQQQQRDKVMREIAIVEADMKRRRPDWRGELSAWATAETSKLVKWRAVVPTDLPFQGQKFLVLEDGSILSESYAPTKGSSTFRLQTQAKKITAFRIDTLTHPQLPRGGPGRSIWGTGALTEFRVTVAPADKPSETTDIKLVRAWADVNPPQTRLSPVFRDKDPAKDDRVTGGIEFAIDGDKKTAWSIDNGPGRRNQDRHAVFFPAEPVQVDGDVILSFTLDQSHGGWNSDDNQNNLLGRYRFSVTDSDGVAETALPSAIESILMLQSANRTEAQIALLFHHWRTTVDEFSDANAAINRLWESFPSSGSQLVVEAMETPRKTFVMKRGDFLNHGEPVTPGVPAFLNPMPPSGQPDRLRLAKWLAADDAPTTARVIVNRMWQSYFGRGLVTTPEDFGFQSAPPSHPQLIDYLAVELMDHGWSLKHIHRLIVSSATYRQSSNVSQQQLQSDPYNQLLARGSRIRVDAEVVRDIALAVSGLLQDQVGGPSVYPPAPDFLFLPPTSYGPKNWNLSTDGQQYRRSLYVHSYRSVPYPSLQVFDAPKGDSACVRRQRSNTPLQALVVLNEPQFVESARAMATRVLREGGSSDHDRLQYALRLCVSRSATAGELKILNHLLNQQRQRIQAGEVELEKLNGTSNSLYQQLTGRSAREFAPWVVVCRAILNLDETITKQ